MSELTIQFDCPSLAFDLSDQSRQGEQFDEWFSIPHEPAPIPPSDEDFFKALQNPQSAQQSKENIPDNRNRKRGLADVAGPPSKVVRPNSSGRTSMGAQVVQPKSATARTADASKLSSGTAASKLRHCSSPRTRPTPTSSSQHQTTTARPAMGTTSSRSNVPTASSSSRSASTGKARPSSAAPAAKESQPSLEQLLKQHNARFAPVPLYEPPMHSVRDVRKWERLSGRQWCDLKPEERHGVNEEITRLKETNQLE